MYLHYDIFNFRSHSGDYEEYDLLESKALLLAWRTFDPQDEGRIIVILGRIQLTGGSTFLRNIVEFIRNYMTW
jgi:hypothetical protein